MPKFRRLAATVSAAAIMTCTATAVMAANIFVVGGKPDDPFWSIVKRGAEDAGKVAEAQGGKVVWLGPQNYDNLGVDAAELIRQAIDQGADAIVGPDWVPEAMDPAFKAVVDKKIPLVIYNAGGIEAADRLGAMNYVGSNDYLSGKAAGTYFAKHDLKNAVCLNTLPGAANIEAFCKGMTDGVTEGGGVGSSLPLPATSFGSATAVAQALKAHLLQHPEIKAVFAIGNVDTNSAVNGVTQAGKQGQVKVCGMNMDETVLNNIKSGSQLCAIDQQGYLQGYLAVSILNGNVNYGLTVPTREILTGPGVIDASNVDATLAGVKAGAR
ncbi:MULTISPECIES: sugar ABC transporter substrate-binding protein [Rhizobium]|uniref:sugar ABC transporter substrate-binding protein n=1 Tax=Rhizobium TaxID=379 RepID=UPI0007EAD83E|nr:MULTISPECIES: sugar ABC transporter substrate-binding protein [Rhizobium]ANK88187.1 sugar ABC transporter substrate-binding protein [Rhizobium sp. N731]ANK93961.1 sugar ABC transporter substrate-binding protein [Rhizobium sp. N6212]ANL00012.1 sugar ABC transporter substrate-binding protein [Rhizobium sp. N621]ANL06141.1 sugar ABC transporter substrate-binding protein [Rhizobium esperanzae]ANL12306.1 sugar ABC transporter substrate-binding protein [Rhizobium sp. N1341]